MKFVFLAGVCIGIATFNARLYMVSQQQGGDLEETKTTLQAQNKEITDLKQQLKDINQQVADQKGLIASQKEDMAQAADETQKAKVAVADLMIEEKNNVSRLDSEVHVGCDPKTARSILKNFQHFIGT